MKKFTLNKNAAVSAVVVASFLLSLVGPSVAVAATAVDLGTASSFAVLAGSFITDSNPAAGMITGDVGLSPAAGTFYTGLTSAQVSGTIYAVDATGPDGAGGNNAGLVNGAKTDLTTAFNSVTLQPTTGVIAANLGGQTLFAGVYDDNDAPDSLAITGTLILDAQGNPNAVFVFKTGSTLTTSVGSVVSLINGAQACNVFWQVGSSAILGVGSNFKGTIMAAQSITDNGGSTVSGRLLARVAAVTLSNTTVTVPTCAPAAVAVAAATRAAATINVVKVVVNDNGGTKTIADFPLFVNGSSVVSGVTNTFPAPAPAYVITETPDVNYTRTFSGDCGLDGRIGLSPGDNKFCIVTNNDIGAPVVAPVPPLIDVVKVADPLSLPRGPGAVAYSYTLRNIGTVPVTNITMVGDTCSPIVLSSGDVNGDSKLDVNETWVYHCSTTLTKTHTNTVVTTGWANGISAVDIASATVVVSLPVVPPLIHVTKIPSPLALAIGGGTVTYTYHVSNPGTVSLSTVRVTDDKCVNVQYVSGDANGDNKLDSSENWVYTCATNLTKTTTNIVSAEGDANALTARDIAIATVVVASPGLPNTGFPSKGITILLSIVALLAISYFGYTMWKKQSAQIR
jgi:uncharacterized repeat protein (TIGR01451 family)